MIIRMTVRDNDFQEPLEAFARGLFNRLYFGKDKPDEMDATEWFEKYYKPQQKIQTLLNPNITESLSDEDKKIICAAVRTAWEEFIDARTALKDSTREYLKDEFRVSVSYTFHDKWENGEVVYYFTTAQRYITQ